MLRVFFLVETFQESFSSFLHFDEARLQPLPELVVLGSAHIARVPNVVLYEFLNLNFPGGPKHLLLDALDRDHQPSHIFN